MIELEAYDMFRENKQTLRELSKDDSSPDDIQYMTESGVMAVDFDLVKRLYVSALGLSEKCAASVDALCQDAQGIAFVEFKNGNVNMEELKRKVWDSLLIFYDITDARPAFTRENADLILVYNKDRYPETYRSRKKRIAEAPSRTAIGKHFMAKGGEEFIRFDLQRYDKLYFRGVYTYDQAEFEEKFLRSRFGEALPVGV